MIYKKGCRNINLEWRAFQESVALKLANLQLSLHLINLMSKPISYK